MLTLFHLCGKCQRCRWRWVFYFAGYGCDLSLWYDMGHLIHKHGVVVDVVVGLADCRRDAKLLYRPFIIHRRLRLSSEATQMWNIIKKLLIRQPLS